jgi:2,4-dienoyl-CoA reductase-like NADH-dependent reductase (Old Yellow Enzyme family)
LLEVISSIRKVVPPDFVFGVRLLAEDTATQRGFDIVEMLELVSWLKASEVTYLHLSSAEVRARSWKYPESGETNLHRIRKALDPKIALMAVGNVLTRESAQFALDEGADFVALGRAAIAMPDWPRRSTSKSFEPVRFPLTPQELNALGVTEPFVSYLRPFNLVAESGTPSPTKNKKQYPKPIFNYILISNKLHACFMRNPFGHAFAIGKLNDIPTPTGA